MWTCNRMPASWRSILPLYPWWRHGSMFFRNVDIVVGKLKGVEKQLMDVTDHGHLPECAWINLRTDILFNLILGFYKTFSNGFNFHLNHTILTTNSCKSMAFGIYMEIHVVLQPKYQHQQSRTYSMLRSSCSTFQKRPVPHHVRYKTHRRFSYDNGNFYAKFILSFCSLTWNVMLFMMWYCSMVLGMGFIEMWKEEVSAFLKLCHYIRARALWNKSVFSEFRCIYVPKSRLTRYR